MPFKKITKGKNKGKFRSPSGKLFTAKAAKAYYAKKGLSIKHKKK